MNNITNKLTEEYPKFKESTYFDPEDVDIPYVLVGQFIAFIKDGLKKGDIAINSEEIKKLFLTIETLENSGNDVDRELARAGFMEALTSGSDPAAEEVLERAAEENFSPEVYKVFQHVKSGRAGNP